MAVRCDKDTPHYERHGATKANVNAGTSEKAFLKRLHSEIADRCPVGASSSLPNDKPEVWEESHQQELQFQNDKRRKKEIDAHTHGHLLPSDQTAGLDDAVKDEQKRQASSYRERVNARVKYTAKTLARPPTLDEKVGMVLYKDSGVMLPVGWLAKLAALSAREATDLSKATAFVATNPRKPCDRLVALAAVLRGSWAMSPNVFMGDSGPSVKYIAAFATKRSIFATPLFKRTYPREWLLVLELANSVPNCKWKFLGSAVEWAAARAVVERKGTPTQVLALVGPGEAAALKHAFSVDGLVDFVGHEDPKMGSIGLLMM